MRVRPQECLKKGIHTGKTDVRYRSYAEANRETINPPMDSPHERVGGTQNPEVTGRDRRAGFSRATRLYYLMEVMGSVRKSKCYRIIATYIDPP